MSMRLMHNWKSLFVCCAAVLAAGCPMPVDGLGEPVITITASPAWGSSGQLSGRVSHVVPRAYRIAVFTYREDANGWWTRPDFVNPLIEIGDDGAWSFSLGSADGEATKIAVFLVPRKTALPMAAGAASLPPALFDLALAHAGRYRSESSDERLIFFSGYEWRVKTSEGLAGPGPNLFSDSDDQVRVDSAGRLHLAITQGPDGPQCAEIISLDSFGYGKYVFRTSGALESLDTNAVLGLFTWSDDSAYHNREIDIEFSRWGDPGNDNAQYVVQPYDTAGNMFRFAAATGAQIASHRFEWRRTVVKFRSVLGTDPDTTDEQALLAEWKYSGPDMPLAGGENTRINFWLTQGTPPAGDGALEAVLDSLAFTPGITGKEDE